MRTLRFALQLLIVAPGLLFATAAFHSGNPIGGFVVLALVVLLLLLTLALREHTETRLDPSQKFNPKVQGGLLAFAGLSLWLSALKFSPAGGTPPGEPFLTSIVHWALALSLFLLGCGVLWFAYRVSHSKA